jgi:protein-L-isoaspartate(D-aspartate) O-methyltransferase
MPGRSPDLFDPAAEGEPDQGQPFARSTLDRLGVTLKLRERGFRDTALLRAFELAPRETFAPRRYADLARRDMALPLPCGQTMTAPLQLARLVTLAAIAPGHRVLEIGAGSGYLGAILAHLAAEVVAIERYRSLAIEAEGKLRGAGLSNVAVLHADGLARQARGVFDRIVVDGRLADWPESLVASLAPGGRIVAAIGEARNAQFATLDLGPDGAREERRYEPVDSGPIVSGLAGAL